MRQSRDQKLKTPVGVAAVVAVVGVALVVAGDRVGEAAVAVQSDDPYVPQAMMGQPVGPAEAVEFTAAEARGVEGDDVPEVSDEALTQVVRRVCVSCHNDALRTADLSLQDYAVDKAPERPETTEKMIEKLRLGMMPPPGIPSPAGDTMTALVETLERQVDEAVAAEPNPGTRPFQRLNRIEYERAIHDLLGLEINAGEFLPQDTRMASFDNIADAQLLSAALVDSYMAAAAEVSRMALGAPEAGPTNTTYLRSGYASQWDRVEGAPFGTRGGISVTHNFRADGEYRFRMTFENTTTGGHVGSTIQNEDLEISIDGEPRAVMKVDQWMHSSDPHAVQMESEPLFIEAGPKRVSVAFINLYDGPVEDLPSPHDWSLADRRIGAGGYGITQFTHLKDVTINGPHNVTGVSEHPVRERVFTCRPSSEAEEEACAAQILEELAERAYRRPVQDHELADLMSFYELGYADGGFDLGVRTGLQAILASPDFIFRLERPADEAEVEEGIYRISDWALASRLSFFLWGSPPDEELREVAREGELSDPDVLEEQTRRMLQDERAEALATRFASQWFRLHDLEHLNPDARQQWLEERWPAILRTARAKNAWILFGDEVSFAQWGSLGYTWARQGQQPVVKTSGKRKGYKVLGVIEFFSGRFFSQTLTERFNSESYQAFLSYVLAQTDRTVILIQDGARYHTSRSMRDFFAAHADRLIVYQLPSYSPDYNPIEFLWKQTKQRATHNQYFPQFDKLMASVDEALAYFAQQAATIKNLMGGYLQSLELVPAAPDVQNII